MYIVYGKNHPLGKPGHIYISGVFEKKETAQDYLYSLEKKFQDNSWLAFHSNVSFPVYFEESTFGDPKPISLDDLCYKIILTPKQSDPDAEYWIYYKFTEDWKAIIKGQKNIAASPHYHLDNDFLFCNLRDILEKM